MSWPANAYRPLTALAQRLKQVAREGGPMCAPPGACLVHLFRTTTEANRMQPPLHDNPPPTIQVNCDHELINVLNNHYNKNRHIEVSAACWSARMLEKMAAVLRSAKRRDEEQPTSSAGRRILSAAGEIFHSPRRPLLREPSGERTRAPAFQSDGRSCLRSICLPRPTGGIARRSATRREPTT